MFITKIIHFSICKEAYKQPSLIHTIRDILESSASSEFPTDRIHFPLLDLRDCTVLSLNSGYFYKFLISLRAYDDLGCTVQHHIVGCIVIQYFLSSRKVELLIADSHISCSDLYSESSSR